MNQQPGVRSALGGAGNLQLPSLWDPEQARSLQVGPADALSRVVGVALGDVQVITTIVHSGHAVEEGKIQEWWGSFG